MLPGRGNRGARTTDMPADQPDHADSGAEAPEWEDRDWEDYNYLPPGGGAGSSGRGLGDMLADLLDGLPGVDADEIDALLRNLPMPDVGDVPGMTVEEAIEVYDMLYILLINMLYNM